MPNTAIDRVPDHDDVHELSSSQVDRANGNIEFIKYQSSITHQHHRNINNGRRTKERRRGFLELGIGPALYVPPLLPSPFIIAFPLLLVCLFLLLPLFNYKQMEVADT